MDVLDARDLKPDPGVPAWQRRAQVVLARLPLVHSLFWIAFFLLIPPLLVGRGGRSWDEAGWLQTRLLLVWMFYGFYKFACMALASVYGMRRCRENQARAQGSWASESSSLAGAAAPAPPPCATPPEAVALDVVELARDDAPFRRAIDDAADAAAADADAEAARVEDVVHLVVIPNYKEPVATLARTLDTLAAQWRAPECMVAVLAMEGRDAAALDTARELSERFRGRFRALLTTVHRLQPGEVGGKSSNENWAVRCAKARLVDGAGLPADGAAAAAPTARRGDARGDAAPPRRRQRVPIERVVVTTCDCDSYFHPNHFEALAAAFVARPARAARGRHERFWQPATCFYPNIDDVPPLCTTRYTALSVGFLGQLANPIATHFPFAVYSVSLKLAERAGYWNPEVIPEDWHMYLRCFYASAGRARVEPLYMPVGCECVASSTPLASLGACYAQSTRWQWGAIDVGYILVMSARALASRAIPPYPVLRLLCAAVEQHFLYPVMWIAVACTPWILGEHWVGARHAAFVCWLAFLVLNWGCLVALDTMYRDLLVADRMHFRCGAGARALGTRAGVRRVAQLALSPLADMLLFVVPSLHAHARMALSTRMDYVVAPKLTSIATKLSACVGRGATAEEAAPLIVTHSASYPPAISKITRVQAQPPSNPTSIVG